MMILTALSVVPAASEGPGIRVAGDAAWKKFCLNDTCHIGRGRRSDCGLIGEVTLVERTAETGKRLSIGLPARTTGGAPAIRMTIDSNEPVSREISRCDCACWIDVKAGSELVEQLRQGQQLVLDVPVWRYKSHIVVIPLAGFAEAYDGPPNPMPEMKGRMASLAGIRASSRTKQPLLAMESFRLDIEWPRRGCE
jgi:invasion protein IalB